MAAQVDLGRIKVENNVRDSLGKLAKEKKKKNKRELSPSADKRQRSSEKEAKKVKLSHHHHHHHPQHVQQQRIHQPHQNGQPQPRNSSTEKPTLHHHHQHYHHHHHNNTKGAKDTHPQSPLPAHKVVSAAAKLDRKKKTVLPPGQFTFTPLKVAKPKAKIQENKEKHSEKELKLKKENTEANVKHGVGLCKKNKGRLFLHILFYSINS